MLAVPVVSVAPDVEGSVAVDPVLVTMVVVPSLKLLPLVPVTVVWSTVEDVAGSVVAVTVGNEVAAEVVSADVTDSAVLGETSVVELTLDSVAVVAVTGKHDE